MYAVLALSVGEKKMNKKGELRIGEPCESNRERNLDITEWALIWTVTREWKIKMNE